MNNNLQLVEHSIVLIDTDLENKCKIPNFSLDVNNMPYDSIVNKAIITKLFKEFNIDESVIKVNPHPFNIGREIETKSYVFNYDVFKFSITQRNNFVDYNNCLNNLFIKIVTEYLEHSNMTINLGVNYIYELPKESYSTIFQGKLLSIGNLNIQSLACKFSIVYQTNCSLNFELQNKDDKILMACNAHNQNKILSNVDDVLKNNFNDIFQKVINEIM